MRKIFSLLFAVAVGFTYAQDQQETDSILTNELDEVIVTSSRVIDVAIERVTPVAVSTITAQEISLKVGNQEFPEIMNNTPGVYATKQGGGYGKVYWARVQKCTRKTYAR